MKTTESLLKDNGYQILGKNLKEQVVINSNGKQHLSLLALAYTVKKAGQTWAVLEENNERGLDPTEPELRKKIVEVNQFFGLQGVLLVNPQKEELQQITLKFPREKGGDFYFQFFIALFILAGVIGIIWLLMQIHLL